MAIYILIATFILLWAFIEVFGSKSNCRDTNTTKYIYLYLCLFLILVAGLRACGFDYYNYLGHYTACHSHLWRTQSEALMVEKSFGLMAYMAPSYSMLLFGIAFISLSVLFYFIRKASLYPIFSLYLLLGLCFYVTFMGQIRQGIAIVFVLLSFRKNSRYKKLLLIGIASIFHISSLLALVQFVVPNKILNRKLYIFLLIIALAMNLTVGELILPLISNYSGLIADKLYIYAVEESGNAIGLNSSMLLRLVIFYIFFRYCKYCNSQSQYGYFLNLYFISLLIYLGLGFIPQLAGRGGLYFNVLEIILAANILRFVPNLQMKLAVFMFFVMVSTYRQISLFTGELGQEYFIPYVSIIQLF